MPEAVDKAPNDSMVSVFWSVQVLWEALYEKRGPTEYGILNRLSDTMTRLCTVCDDTSVRYRTNAVVTYVLLLTQQPG